MRDADANEVPGSYACVTSFLRLEVAMSTKTVRRACPAELHGLGSPQKSGGEPALLRW